MSGNIVQYSKYPVAGERGNLTLDFVNDQWNFARQFWDSYLKRAAYKHLVEFFDNLRFDVTCEIYNNNMMPYITHKFTDCVVFNLQEEEFSWANASTIPIIKLDVDYKKHEVSYNTKEMWSTSDSSVLTDKELGLTASRYVFIDTYYQYFQSYANTIKNTYKTLRTIQNVMAFGNTVLPLVGELGRYLPLGAVATMAIASVVKINGIASSGPMIMTARGPMKASDALFEKSLIDPTFLSGDLSQAVNSISEGSLVSKQVEYVIAWIRSAIYQGEYLGGINGGAPDKQTVWDLDMKNKFLLAKSFPLSANGGIDTTGRNPMVSLDGVTDADKTTEFNTLQTLRGKDVTGGFLGANKIDPYRAWDISRHKLTRIDYGDTYTRTKNVTNILSASDIQKKDIFTKFTVSQSSIGTPGANREVDGVIGTKNPWVKDTYGVIPSIVLDSSGNIIPNPKISQIVFRPSDSIVNITQKSSLFQDGGIDVYQRIDYGPTLSPIISINPPASDVADGGLGTHVKDKYNNQQIDSIVLLASDKADGGLYSKQKIVYGPSESQIDNIILPSMDSADGGISTHQHVSYQGKLVNKNLNQPEGSISGFKKDSYGALVDNTVSMKDVAFLSPSDELKLKQQVRSIVDKGVDFWKKNKYGPINDSSINAYGNDQEPNPTLAEVMFDTNIPLINAPLELNDPKVIADVQASIASIFINRSTEGKLIVNDLSDPKVAQAAYALFLRNMTQATENVTSNNASVLTNGVMDNVSSNKADIIMKNVDNVLKNQNTTTRNVVALSKDSKNNASITIIDNDNTNNAMKFDKSEFDLKNMSADKKALISKEMSVMQKQIEDSLLRPLGTRISNEAIQNFNQDSVSLKNEKKNETSPKLSGFNLDSGIKNSAVDTIPKSAYNLQDYIRTDGVTVDKTPYAETNKKETISNSSILDSYRKKVEDSTNPDESEKISSDLLDRYKRMVDSGFPENTDGQSSSSETC
jgi:hypothetical protein